MAFLPFFRYGHFFGQPLILIVWKVTRLARRGKHFFAGAAKA
jgi:hypothetical protein